MKQTLMWFLTHFHRYDFVYLDNCRCLRNEDQYEIWVLAEGFWWLCAYRGGKIDAFVTLIFFAHYPAYSAGYRIRDENHNMIKEKRTNDHRNRALDPLDELLLSGLQDEPGVRDMLLDVLHRGG